MDRPTFTKLRERYGPIPAVLLPVVDVAGEEAMLRLVHERGGLDVTVPAPERIAGSELHQALGVPVEVAAVVARRLRDRHGLGITVPRMTGWLNRLRTARIVALRADGLRIQDIAQKLGVTERTVYLALARHREQAPDDRQLDLFGPPAA